MLSQVSSAAADQTWGTQFCYFAVKRVRADAMTAPFLRASTIAFHEPAIGTVPLPAYACWPATHERAKEFLISGMFIAGMAGMTSVTVTCASLMTLPLASVTVAWNAFSCPPFRSTG